MPIEKIESKRNIYAYMADEMDLAEALERLRDSGRSGKIPNIVDLGESDKDAIFEKLDELIKLDEYLQEKIGEAVEENMEDAVLSVMSKARSPEQALDLDSAEGVERALLSGKDLYNVETGQFFWLYDEGDSIAYAWIDPDDPNLLACVDEPDFDMYEDIVGGLNYPGYVIGPTEALEAYHSPAIPQDAKKCCFEQIAAESGWGPATADRIRRAVDEYARGTRLSPSEMAGKARAAVSGRAERKERKLGKADLDQPQSAPKR